MTEAKHSPGPWKSHPIERHQGLPYVPVSAETLIARVYSKHFGDDAQAEANGLLVAAAPELLEALRAAHRSIDRTTHRLMTEVDDGVVPSTEAELDTMRLIVAVIAKATGSAQ